MKTITKKMQIIADAIIEHQQYGQVCPATIKALKEISKEKEK